MKEVVSTTYEGRYTYILLTDGKIMRSRDMETNHCAKVYAEMIPDLDLTVDQLIRWCNWTETDE